MFYQDGWVPLSDLTRKIFAKHRQAAQNIRPPDGERPNHFELSDGQNDPWLTYDNDLAYARSKASSEAAMEVWSILDRSERIGVLTASGRVVRASRNLLDCHDPTDTVGVHVDLHKGTVGSATWEVTDEYGSSYFETEVEKSERFGPFLYCQILVPEVDAEVDSTNDGSVEAEPSDLPSDIISTIVDIFDRDQTVTKSWIRRNICPELKVIAFHASWAEATKLRPALSKPGPKPRRSASSAEFDN